jgi:predicted dehydrogenase
MDRRHFIMSGAALAAGAVTKGIASPNDTLRVAVIGLGGRGPTAMGRGKDHIQTWAKIPNTRMVAICDIDDAQIAKGLKLFETLNLQKPEVYKDVRKLVESKDIDVLSIASPNHWHTLMAIWGMQNGKDVYVEKPCAHNMFEARQIVAAARKYNRIVQQGSQIRSSDAVREGIQKMREGMIGDVYLARGLCYKWRDTIGRAPEEPVPAGVDYDLWTGPSPMHHFTRNRFHYNWHWFWDTGNGDLGNQGIHQVDIARWGLGVRYPAKVSAIGGHFMFDDDQETPNTLNVSYEFNENGKRKLMEFEVRHWMSNGEAPIGPQPHNSGGATMADSGAPLAGGNTRRGPNSDSIGNLFYGRNGYMVVDSYHSYKTWMGREQEPGPSNADSDEMTKHVQNFVDGVRSRNRENLHAEIEEGAASTVLVHLANISYRVGRTLHFDSEKFEVVADSEANAMFTRNYRKPFVVPRNV